MRLKTTIETALAINPANIEFKREEGDAESRQILVTIYVRSFSETCESVGESENHDGCHKVSSSLVEHFYTYQLMIQEENTDVFIERVACEDDYDALKAQFEEPYQEQFMASFCDEIISYAPKNDIRWLTNRKI